MEIIQIQQRPVLGVINQIITAQQIQVIQLLVYQQIVQHSIQQIPDGSLHSSRYTAIILHLQELIQQYPQIV